MSVSNRTEAGRSRKRRLDASQEESQSQPASPRGPSCPVFRIPNPPLSSPVINESTARDNSESDPYGDSGLLLSVDLPNDTMATIMYLQQEFYGDGAAAARGRQGSSTSGTSASHGKSTRASGGGPRTGIVLQHQIYTVLTNRTAVDVELTTMRKSNVIRTFRLGTGREDWGFMSTEHYMRLTRNALDETRRSVSEGLSRNASRSDDDNSSGIGKRSGPRAPPPSLEVFLRLVNIITRAYATRKEIADAMRHVSLQPAKDAKSGAEANKHSSIVGDISSNARPRLPAVESRKGEVQGETRTCDSEGDEELDELPDLMSLKRTDESVLALTSELVRAGFLLPRRDVGREEAYWFSMPQLGKVTVAISRGRKDIIGALKRTRYKEMRRAALEAKNPAKSTGLPVAFHVRDLLGLGLIRQLDTPSGAFLRLVPDP